MAGKRRYYSLDTIELLKKIKFLLKDKGMTIRGAKNELLNQQRPLDEINNISITSKNILKNKLSRISKLVKNLKK